MSDLSGKTLFITGASRGIGKAIALRAARDGANIAVLGKTDAPHPRLPGTVPSSVADIEAAGGHAIGCITDIRFEDQIEVAVQETLDAFGGIDILVNNASAIFLAGTLDTPAKRYDLMQAVNARGTFFASQACLPHLIKATNPHILTMSPPLNMQPHWFADHVAYTMSKYGMSMCMLGMAVEFSRQGVAVNSLWPRTAIATAAVRNLMGGDAAVRGCRKPEIVADAAHAILIRDARACTGHFFVDDEVLAEEGVTDLEQYAVAPGEPLHQDFFL